MLLGMAGLLLVLAVAFSSSDGGIAPISLDTQDTPGDASSAKGLQVTLNSRGIAAVSLPVTGLAARDYPYLHIGLSDFSDKLRMALAWEHSGEETAQVLPMKARPRESLWIATHEIDRWRLQLEGLRLVFFGAPGQTLRVQDFSLHPAGLGRQLHAMLDDLGSFVPWRPGNINSHSAVTKTSPFYPAPLFALLLACCLSGFALVSLLDYLRGKCAAPNWTAAGLVFLLCWVGLDAVWQYKLLRQLGETRADFAGKSREEKLLAGPDAELYAFVARARALMSPADARVFVSSSDNYTGLRGAYYLYPFNAYWKKDGHELPHPAFLRRGDYIMVLQPASLRVARRRGMAFSADGSFPVEVLLASQGRQLLRVL
ncbi:MAG: hypothetical protein CME59_21115 [Halioglobus sp.]|nr:hypothetical protein [Halioglobus sp.]|tara:strand:- start:4366 stop:5478 length:1113 start_codon:yes stop_codon:yes gene_type:complete